MRSLLQYRHLTGIGLAALLALVTPSRADDAPTNAPATANTMSEPRLFEPFVPATTAPTVAAAAAQRIAPGATLVTLEPAALLSAKAGDLLMLDAIAPAFDGRVERIEQRSSARKSVFGTLQDDPESSFIIVIEDNVAVGVFRHPLAQESYRLQYVDGRLHQVVPIDWAAEKPCQTESANEPESAAKPTDDPVVEPPNDAFAAGGIDLGGCPAPRRYHDVIIYYTAQARSDAGGSSAMNAECQLAVDTANQAYIDSGISPRIRLVHRREIGYTESGDLETDRDALHDDNDGVMDFAHTDRDDFGADFVSLFVDNSADGGGIAFCTPGANKGFCVVVRNVASSNFTFAHELGHLQGSAHNHGDAGFGCNQYCYSFGHRDFGNSGAGFRTVMAYNDDASNFPRIGRFSDPDRNFDGVPLGVDTFPCGVFPSNDDADNVRSINNTAADREGWRDPKFQVWVELGYSGTEIGTYQQPWATIPRGIDAIYDGTRSPAITPVLKIKAGTGSATPTIDKAMIIKACGGTVRIGD